MSGAGTFCFQVPQCLLVWTAPCQSVDSDSILALTDPAIPKVSLKLHMTLVLRTQKQEANINKGPMNERLVLATKMNYILIFFSMQKFMVSG